MLIGSHAIFVQKVAHLGSAYVIKSLAPRPKPVYLPASLGVSPSGKASVFGTDIPRFDP